MFISEAITQLMGKPEWYAWRPTGEVFIVTNRGALKAVRPKGPGEFRPKASDLMSDEWQVGDIQSLKRALAVAAHEAQG